MRSKPPMGIRAKAPDELFISGHEAVKGVVEQHIHGVEHDQHRLRRKLRQHSFQALHFHREAEWMRKRGEV